MSSKRFRFAASTKDLDQEFTIGIFIPSRQVYEGISDMVCEAVVLARAQVRHSHGLIFPIIRIITVVKPNLSDGGVSSLSMVWRHYDTELCQLSHREMPKSNDYSSLKYELTMSIANQMASYSSYVEHYVSAMNHGMSAIKKATIRHYDIKGNTLRAELSHILSNVGHFVTGTNATNLAASIIIRMVSMHKNLESKNKRRGKAMDMLTSLSPQVLEPATQQTLDVLTDLIALLPEPWVNWLWQEIKVGRVPEKLSAKILEQAKITRPICEAVLQTNDGGFYRSLAMNHEIPADILALLAEHSDSVQGTVVLHHKCPESFLQKKMTEGSQFVRRAIAGAPNVTPEMLRHLSHDFDTAVREMVAANAKTPLDALPILLFDASYNVRRLAARHLKALNGQIRMTEWMRDNMGFASGRLMGMVNDIIANDHDPSWIVAAGLLLRPIYESDRQSMIIIFEQIRLHHSTTFAEAICKVNKGHLSIIVDVLRLLAPDLRDRLVLCIAKAPGQSSPLTHLAYCIERSRSSALEVLRNKSSARFKTIKSLTVILENALDNQTIARDRLDPKMTAPLPFPRWAAALDGMLVAERLRFKIPKTRLMTREWGVSLKNCLRDTYYLENMPLWRSDNLI